MKNWLFIVLCCTATVLWSCSNEHTDPSSTPTAAMPAEEQRLRQAIADKPDSIVLHEELIQYFRDNQNYSAAIKAAEQAIQQDTASARLWDIKAILHYENQDTLQAIQALERAVELDAQPEYIISLGTAYAETKNPLALEMAQALLMSPLAKADLQAGFIQGLYYSHTAQYDKAIRIFDQLIRADYTNVMAYREKAIALLEQGKPSEAIPVLETAIEVQTTYEEGYYWLGKCFEQLKDTRKAIAAYQQALQLDPNYLEAQDALGRLGAR
jgi:tetratricopeptide (TPR) repeat protein